MFKPLLAQRRRTGSKHKKRRLSGDKGFAGQWRLWGSPSRVRESGTGSPRRYRPSAETILGGGGRGGRRDSILREGGRKGGGRKGGGWKLSEEGGGESRARGWAGVAAGDRSGLPHGKREFPKGLEPRGDRHQPHAHGGTLEAVKT